MEMIYQQGDVLLKVRDCLPQMLKRAKLTEHGLVLAWGEATGHKHKIPEMDKAELYEDENGVLWLKVKNPVTLIHEEHKSQNIRPGIYEIGIVKEVDPFTEEIRAVKD